MKKQSDVYLIIHNKLGPVGKRLYLTERNAIKQFQYCNKDIYSLCKYTASAVLENGEWVNVEDEK